MMKFLEQRIREWEEAERAQSEKPRYYAGLSRFVRFSDYKFEKVGKYQQLSIVPTENARIEWYRPFDFEPGPLRDYLEVRNALRRARNNEEQFILDHMMSFIDGDMPSSEREKERAIKRVKAATRSYTRENRKFRDRAIANTEKQPILTPELESGFQSRLDRDKPLILDFCRRYGDVASGHASESTLRHTYDVQMNHPRPLPKSRRMDFEAWIREHPDLQSGLVANWYYPSHIVQMYDAWDRFRTSSAASEPVDQFIESLNGFAVQAGLRLVFLNGHWGIDFEVSHLRDALGVMLINNITSGRDQIRMCALKDCHRPFLTRDPRANYCCHAHSQRGRVRKHREKQNGKKQ
jgi:hypothetical protein